MDRGEKTGNIAEQDGARTPPQALAGGIGMKQATADAIGQSEGLVDGIGKLAGAGGTRIERHRCLLMWRQVFHCAENTWQEHG